MKRFLRRPVLYSLCLAAMLAFLAGLVWHGYATLGGAYKRLIVEGATMPKPGSPDVKFVDAYHDAIALGFRDALRRGEAENVFFNDSVMGGHTDDEPRTTIAEMLEGLTGLSIYPVSGAGYAGELFREYAALIDRAEKPPRLAIVSVNLRSFADGWFFTPRWMYAGTVAYMRLLANPPTLSDAMAWVFSGESDPEAFLRARAARKEALGEDFFRDLNALREKLLAKTPSGLGPNERDRRKHFIENYMMRLTPDHPMLIALRETARRLKLAGVTPFFYLTPIDVQGGTELVGETFAPTIAENARLVMAALAGEGAVCLDLSSLLPQDLFVDRDYACEHLNLEGRGRVAGAIANELGRRGLDGTRRGRAASLPDAANGGRLP